VLRRDGVCLAEADDARLDRAREEVHVVRIRERGAEGIPAVLEVLDDLARSEGVDGGGRAGVVLRVAEYGQLDLCAFGGGPAEDDDLGNGSTWKMN
jgi:hypothetical protein